MKEIAGLIVGILGLLKPNESGNQRRNLRLSKRMYKRLKKEFRKDGFDNEEKKLLKDLRNSIVKRSIELGN